MTTSIQKIQRMGDRGYLLTIILMAIAVLTAVAAFAMTALVLINPEFIHEVMNEITTELNISDTTIAVAFVLAGLMATLIAIALYYAGKMFKDLRNSHTPFKAEYAKAMKIVSIIVLVAGLITFSLATICIAILLYCFAQVFEYGVELQQVADETL